MATPLRLLLVEDSPDDAALVLRTLKRGGYDPILERVDTPAATKAALLDPQGWDLVICDYRMPEFSAPAALALVHESGLDLPFVIVSGAIGEEAAVAVMKLGAHDYVMKGNLARLPAAIARELREAEDRRERRRAEDRYRGLFEDVPVGIYRTTLDGRIVAANPALIRMLGYDSLEELAGRNLEGEAIVDDAPRIHFKELLAETGEVQGYLARWQRKDQSVIVVRENARAIREAGGAISHYEGTVEDVTEQARLEDQLRQSQKMDAIGQLAGGVAHDFNNLLTVILGRTELQLGRLGPDDPARRDLGIIHDSGRQAADLTRQILAFSRRQVLRPKVLSLNGIVSELDPMLRRLIGEDIDTRIVLDPALGRANVDRAQIKQVLINLAVNARDAMPQGGTLTIETGNADLEETHVGEATNVKAGPHVMLAVSDTGIGMDEKTRTRAFEPFFTTKPPGRGTGLGLSTVYGIVMQSGGHIAVSSEPGRGTTFKIYLPLVEGAFTPATSPGTPIEELRGSETILLAEDDEKVRSLMRDILESHGYTVLEAQHGAEALEIGTQHPGRIHLLVTDVVMPVMSGSELVRCLGPFRPEMRILYVSGYTAHAIANHGVLGAGTSFLEKPFTPDGLALQVRGGLDAPREAAVARA